MQKVGSVELAAAGADLNDAIAGMQFGDCVGRCGDPFAGVFCIFAPVLYIILVMVFIFGDTAMSSPASQFKRVSDNVFNNRRN